MATRVVVYRPTTWAQNKYNYYRRDHLGNNCAVWDATNDTTLQKTVYYASGLPLSVSSGQSTQPYKYNGKEFIEMHGLDVTDLGFRSVHNARGRFDNMDPLCELAYHSSPYAISANNPVNNVDVLGLKSMGSWELNYTEVNKKGKITKHEDNGDYRIFEVDEDGNKTFKGIEMPGESYFVDGYLHSNDYIKTNFGVNTPTKAMAKDVYDAAKQVIELPTWDKSVIISLLDFLFTVGAEIPNKNIKQYSRAGQILLTLANSYNIGAKKYNNSINNKELAQDFFITVVSLCGWQGYMLTSISEALAIPFNELYWDIERRCNNLDNWAIRFNMGGW